METVKVLSEEYDEQIKKLLDDFMLDMYKGNDHIIARKYFHDLFNKLIPKYFCICDCAEGEVESKK